MISENVSFSDNTLIINLPNGSYENGEKYCIVIGQQIPIDTTIAAEVVITIGDNETQYPLVNSNCTNVSACKINSRMRYATRVYTNISDGVFKLLSPINCSSCSNNTSGGALPKISTNSTSTSTTTNTTGGENG